MSMVDCPWFFSSMLGILILVAIYVIFEIFQLTMVLLYTPLWALTLPLSQLLLSILILTYSTAHTSLHPPLVYICFPFCMLVQFEYQLSYPRVAHSHYSINSRLTWALFRISVHYTYAPLPSEIGTLQSRRNATHKLKLSPICHQNSTSLYYPM